MKVYLDRCSMKIDSGISSFNWIGYSSGNLQVTATMDKHGNIYFNSTDEYENSLPISSFLLIFAIPIFIKLFVLLPLIQYNKISEFWYLLPLMFFIAITIYAIYRARKKEGIEFLRNHAAEHMVSQAYKKLNRIPEIKEVYNFNRIDKSCGGNIFGVLITTQLFGLLMLLFAPANPSFLMLLLLAGMDIMTSVYIFLLGSYFPFNLLGKFIQLFTTAKPKDKNIKLAIAALKELESLYYNSKST